MSSGNLSGWKNQGVSWFLGIGINKYAHFTDLANAVRDVQVFQQLMMEKYDVSEEHAITLFDEKATEENIIENLDLLTKKVGKDDKLIIYYSGHGRLNQELDRGYWLPHDAKKTSTSRYILNSTIQDYVGGIEAKHVLVISDSCFSGSIFMHGEYRSTEAVQGLEERKSRWALCSGRADEEVFDGAIGDHSPFAKSLIQYLSVNNKEAITIGQVVNQVIEETAANYKQLPDGRPMFGVGHGGGQYVFRRSASAKSQHSSEEKTQPIKGETDSKGTNTNSNNTEINITVNGKKATKGDLKMVKWIIFGVLGIFLVVAGIIFFGLQAADENGMLETTIIETGKVQDQIGNIYSTVKIGNTEWMAENMNTKLAVEEDWSRNNSANELGLLYTNQGAEQACQKLIGDNWRLPTTADLTNASRYFGGSLNRLENNKFKIPPPIALKFIDQNPPGLNFQLAGFYIIDNQEFVPENTDEIHIGTYWLQNNNRLYIDKQSEEYIMEVAPVTWNHAYSCRCVRSVQ